MGGIVIKFHNVKPPRTNVVSIFPNVLLVRVMGA